MKKCTVCKNSKEENAFSKNLSRKDGLQTECKECRKVYIRQHYKANKKYYKSKAADKQKLIRQKIIEIKDYATCIDCKKSWRYYQMQFDHLRDKKYDMASIQRFGSWKLVEKEIKKCELVCANCHAERTHKRRLCKSPYLNG